MNALERTCKGCGEWAVCYDGYCGECAPASSVASYVAWWNEHYTDLALMPISFFDALLVGDDGQGDELVGHPEDISE